MNTSDLPDTLLINGTIAYKCVLNPYYYVTEYGFIYSTYVVGGRGSVDIHRPHLLLVSEDKYGYYRVVLCVNGVKQYLHIHTIVAEQFIGRVLNTGLTVDHIDGDKHNNHYTNLRIISSGDNTRHAHELCLIEHSHQLRITVGGRTYWIPSKAEAVRMFPDLSIWYLTQIENKVVNPSMVLFKKVNLDANRSVIQAIYNGELYKTFNAMCEADSFFGKHKGFVSAAILAPSEYRHRVNRYHIDFM